jgi:hypothetical protein
MGFRDEFMAALPAITNETFNMNEVSRASPFLGRPVCDLRRIPSLLFSRPSLDILVVFFQLMRYRGNRLCYPWPMI